jgi:hypothetical protein
MSVEALGGEPNPGHRRVHAPPREPLSRDEIRAEPKAGRVLVIEAGVWSLGFRETHTVYALQRALGITLAGWRKCWESRSMSGPSDRPPGVGNLMFPAAIGVVTAWNDKDIKNVPVHWEER